MINQVTLVGNDSGSGITKNNGWLPVTSVTLAVSRQFRNQHGEIEADFVNCTLWKKAAENTVQYCRKGSVVGVTGRLQHPAYYYNKEGNEYT